MVIPNAVWGVRNLSCLQNEATKGPSPINGCMNRDYFATGNATGCSSRNSSSVSLGI